MSEPLTTRECEVVELLAKGHTAQQSGAILGIADRTVRFHLDNARHKIGAKNRVHLVALVVAGAATPEAQTPAEAAAE